MGTVLSAESSTPAVSPRARASSARQRCRRRAILLLLAVALSGCAFFREASPTEAPTPTVSVSAEQVAQAMADDSFFSDYRNEALLVRGTVSSVETASGATLVTLSTGLATAVVCDLGERATTIRAGDSITVLVNSSDVKRLPDEVLLSPCAVQ